MPPFTADRAQTDSPHRDQKPASVFAALFGAAFVVVSCSMAEIIKRGRHFKGATITESIKADINSSAAVVMRAFGRVTYQTSLGTSFPQLHLNGPGSIAVVKDETKTTACESFCRCLYSFG